MYEQRPCDVSQHCVVIRVRKGPFYGFLYPGNKATCVGAGTSCSYAKWDQQNTSVPPPITALQMYLGGF
jgi:hypothetical protein